MYSWRIVHVNTCIKISFDGWNSKNDCSICWFWGITISTIAAIQQQPGRTCLKHEDITNIHQWSLVHWFSMIQAINHHSSPLIIAINRGIYGVWHQHICVPGTWDLQPLFPPGHSFTQGPKVLRWCNQETLMLSWLQSHLTNVKHPTENIVW